MQFLPFSDQSLVDPATGYRRRRFRPFRHSPDSLPAQSLNGSINTLLVNNVVTTQITSDLKTKFSYRYYDYDNQTPQLHLADWIIADAASAANGGSPVNTRR